MLRNWDRQEVIQILSLSGTLAGLCITSLTVFRVISKSELSATIADDILACSALCFLIATFMLFFSLRVKKERVALFLEKIGDVFFLCALTGMVSSGFIMIYTVW